MLIKIQGNHDHMVVKIQNDIMMSNVAEFSDEFRAVFDKNPKFLSIDLQDVKFMDSSGIGALINLTSEIKKKGTEISVFNMHKSLYSVFKLSGLYHIMELYKDNADFFNKFPDLEV